MLNNEDKLWIGLLAGLVVPFVGYAVLLQLLEFLGSADFLTGKGLNFNFKPRTLALLAIALNVILLRVFRKTKGEKTIRGVVFATLVYAAVWFFYFGKMLEN